MKKTRRKLVLRSETLRTLADTDLSRVVGGFGSGNAQCPHQNLADTGPVACSTDAVATATAACR